MGPQKRLRGQPSCPPPAATSGLEDLASPPPSTWFRTLFLAFLHGDSGGQLRRRGQEKEGAPAHRGAEGLKHGERAAFYFREARTHTRSMGPAQGAPVMAFGPLVTRTPDSVLSQGPPEGQEGHGRTPQTPAPTASLLCRRAGKRRPVGALPPPRPSRPTGLQGTE